jgi:N-terminal domain of anti-restriction factor ArdC
MKPCTVNDNAQSDESPKQDIYARITAKIVAVLEDGVRPWVRPWNAEHAAGRITRPCGTTASPTPASIFCRCERRPGCRASPHRSG